MVGTCFKYFSVLYFLKDKSNFGSKGKFSVDSHLISKSYFDLVFGLVCGPAAIKAEIFQPNHVSVHHISSMECQNK